MRRFYASPDQFQNNEVHLSFEESKHLRNVLRLREGDEASVFDGEGRQFDCRIKSVGGNKDSAVLEIISESAAPSRESKLDLTLAIALMKGDKFDLVVQKATELGVTRIVPLLTKRVDVKIKNAEEASKKLERWRRIAMEAVKQCGRAKLPEISLPAEYNKFIAGENGTVFFFSECGGKSFSTLISEISQPGKMAYKITAVVGPEGGWEDGEISIAQENNCLIVTLGGRVLRAETAGIIVVALLQNKFGDLN